MRAFLSMLVVIALGSGLACCGAAGPAPEEAPLAKAGPTLTQRGRLEIGSPAFEPGGTMPVQYTCFGDNVSPPLTWSGVPAGTRAVVLLVDDPDSRPPGFVHWVLYDIPPATTGLGENVPGDVELADGSRQGSNDFAPYGHGTFPSGAEKKLVGYDGPCPPGGTHHYVFSLYALDAALGLPGEATMAEVKAAMEGHILVKAELTGQFAPP